MRHRSKGIRVSVLNGGKPKLVLMQVQKVFKFQLTGTLKGGVCGNCKSSG